MTLSYHQADVCDCDSIIALHHHAIPTSFLRVYNTTLPLYVHCSRRLSARRPRHEMLISQTAFIILPRVALRSAVWMRECLHICLKPPVVSRVGRGEIRSGLYPAVCFIGGKYETVRGWSRPRVEARSAKRGRGLCRGCPPPQGWGSGVSPPGKFCNLRRNLVQSGAFWQEIDGSPLQLSTFVNENIAIMLDSGIDIVAYYFNF